MSSVTDRPGRPYYPGTMSSRGELRALVLAGSREGETDDIARNAGVSCKALAPVAGGPMIERALRVLLACPRIGRIEVALAPQASIASAAPHLAGWLEQNLVQLVAPASSPARTVDAALDEMSLNESLLITTADHALLDTAMLAQFLDRCSAPDVDAFAALLPLEILEARYPDMQRTGLRLRDGRYSGCNLFLLRNGPGARSLTSFWIRLETLRKSPLRMARALGPATLLGYALRMLTLPQALRKIGTRTGATLAPAILDIAEAAIDVDTPGDLEFVEKLLKAAG